jgi:hypothetical protein
MINCEYNVISPGTNNYGLAVNESYHPSNCLEPHVGNKLPTLYAQNKQVYDELPCLFTRQQNTITALDEIKEPACAKDK